MVQQGLAQRQCLAYLDKVKNLEMQCYQLERLRNKISYQLRNAKNTLQSAQNRSLPEIPPKPNFLKGLIGTEIAAVLISIALGTVFGGIEWFLKFNVINRKPLFFYVSAAVAGVGTALVIAAFLFHVFGFLMERADYPKQIQHRVEEERKVNNTITFSQQQIQLYTQDLRKCEAALSQSRSVLKRYYDQNILYPQYRGLVPVFTIYEYLDAGLCTTLTGHEGAYNIYEQELRFNKIMGKLDDIIERLDNISETQRMLVQEIRNSNAKIDRVVSSLGRMEQSVEEAKYYNSITASNTEYLAWINTTQFIYSL